ncbi:stress-inducible protein STI1-like, putative [Trypanosoma equiperdum]|uniref:Stress-inducible protein STI1-like, putative n=3 Tax=Trypanozoon TaxID=39700 RepID=Q4FKQ3_TRYB2|nr:stress-inducible protein STI1-like, putative [Trypanosoma brucei brucei TREU927]EAN77864.1 stress-inducible protein STI1-like, putative [Trypanosoma brucei brucei TREU927]RHW68974.1 stress-inducible protein STI1-like [Trypanosoma brucei equiperdum]CAJ16746.1 stress-inducible protein STI1-like, putative [Trypanosoma brucei brucei TREU927]SCU67413.1 stress-inducible protein STI1-like, putative [Trypanosoma equiperdum]
MSVADLKAKGNEAFTAKRYEEAIEWYTKAINVDPQSEGAAALYSNRAACWNALAKYKEALEDAEGCISVKPQWFKGYFRKGAALQAMGNYDEAQKALQQSLKTDPNNEELMARLQEINNILKERNEKASPASCRTPEEAKVIGNSLFGAGKYERAALFYSRAIELSTGGGAEVANYYANRAACNQQTHSYQLVIDDCNAALSIEPAHVKALLRRAIAYEGLEKWKKALEDYNQVNRLAPGNQSVSQGVLRCQRAVRG